MTKIEVRQCLERDVLTDIMVKTIDNTIVDAIKLILVTSHLNNNIIKWNLTPNNIKSQVAEYKVTPYNYPRYLKGNTKAHYNAYNPKGVRDSQYLK